MTKRTPPDTGREQSSSNLNSGLPSLLSAVFLSFLLPLACWTFGRSALFSLSGTNNAPEERASKNESSPSDQKVPEPYRTLTPPPFTDRSKRAGKRLYEEHCEVCHGSEGAGNGPAADALDPSPQPFSSTNFVNQYSDQYMYWRISEGKKNTAMPGFRQVLTEQKRWQIVHYLHVLAGRR